jgi:hypothetical protein
MSTVNSGPQVVKNGLVLNLDASYMRSYSPNVMPNPTDIFAWCGAAATNSCTLSRDATITRQYGSIPLKMVVSGNDAYIASYGNSSWNLSTAANGQTWTVSVYVKASVATSGELFLFGADSSGNYGGAGTYGGSAVISITTSWTRVSASFTISGVNVAYVQVRLDGPNSGGSGQTIWWDGLQIERASSATNFNPYYIGNTIWRDVSGNSNNSALVNTNSQNYFSANAGYIQFDGTDDYVSISSPNTDTRLQNNYQTVSFFIYITSVGPNACAFLYAVGGNANGVCIGWLTDSVRFFISNGASNVNYAVNMTNALNTWMNITCIVDNVGRTMTVYKNGSLIGTSSQWPLFTTPSSNVTIGNNSMTGNTGDFIKGRIANVLVYNRSLTATEISQNYEADKTKFGL